MASASMIDNQRNRRNLIMDNKCIAPFFRENKRAKFNWRRSLVMGTVLISIGIGIGMCLVSDFDDMFDDPDFRSFSYSIPVPSMKGDVEYIKCKCECPGDDVIPVPKEKPTISFTKDQ